ncbi:MAG TPA: ribosome maturation factor RimP [Elusimicrobiota bacterium]|jgi:ribosome maturation factor RimP|nr:ribosome maturation factor RimP [Elusimicrobiota bacterium]
MTAQTNLAEIEKSVEGLLSTEAAELVDMQYRQEGGRWVLRFFIDKANGFTLEDCEYFSERIGGLLDALDAVPHAYSLEISSPGLDRVLRKERDFVRFAGHRVRMKLKSPVEGRRKMKGVLQGVEDGKIAVEVEGRALRVDLASIEEARLDPEIAF